MPRHLGACPKPVRRDEFGTPTKHWVQNLPVSFLSPYKSTLLKEIIVYSDPITNSHDRSENVDSKDLKDFPLWKGYMNFYSHKKEVIS